MKTCTELLEELDKACTVDNTVPEGQRAAEWRRYAKARLARAPIAPDHFAACVKALEADLAATRHPPSCKTCQAEEWCEDRSNLVIRASGLRNDALVAVRNALEAAVPRSRPGSGEVK